MKNIFKILVAFISLFTIASCENEDNLLILQAPEAGFTILTPDSGSKIILNKATADNIATNIAWQAAKYGETPAVINYTLQIAKANTDFLAPIDLATTKNTTTAGISVAELNKQAIAFGIEAEKSGAIELRVKSTLGADAEPAYSNIITLMVTPYVASVPIVDLFLVGDATAVGWNTNDNNLPLFRDITNPSKFTFTGDFKVGSFKMLTGTKQWDVQYGTNDGTKLAIGGDGTGNFTIATAGMYTFTINTADMTTTLTPYTATPKTYPTIFVDGDPFGGWDVRKLMTKTADAHIWKVSGTFLAGNFKFHSEMGWGDEWGYDGTKDNIVLEAGNQDIYFNDIDGKYMFIKK